MKDPRPPGNLSLWNFRSAALRALTLFLCFARNPFLSAQSGKSGNEDSYTIRGTVINSVTHAAVGRALVYSTDNRFARLTDAEGHFQWKVPQPPPEPGSVSQTVTQTFSRAGVIRKFVGAGIVLMARKPGYFDSQSSQQPIQMDSAGTSEITIALVPEAFITGRVNLPVNDGTQKIQVAVYRRQVQDGRGHWVSAGNVSTRANGEFHFANLREGDYKLFTQELLDRDPLTFDPRGPLFGYPPVYYPSSADFESAAVIHVKAGQTFSATLTPSRREYYRVKLGVVNMSLEGGLRINVEPQGRPGPGYSLGYNANVRAIEGTLPNGTYSVEVTKYGDPGAAGVLNFSVSGAPLQGPTVMLMPNSLIEVRVNDERTKTQNGPQPELPNLVRSVNVRLVASDEFGQPNQLWLKPPKNPDDESLAFGNAHAGSYRVLAGWNPTAYVAAISSGGRDLLRQPLVVGLGAPIAPIEITIRDDGAQVHGTIEDWPARAPNQPMPNFSGNSPVIVFLPLPNSSGQFCQAWVSPAGEFNLTQVPPGEYRVIAFEHMPEELEYDNAAAMKNYESKGQVLRLVAGQNEELRLALNSGSD